MRRVVIAVFPGVELLDVTGPAEVFSAASRLLGRHTGGYQVQLAAEEPGPIRTVNGIQLIAEVSWAEVAGDADTVIIPGALELGRQGPRPLINDHLVTWVVEHAASWRRVSSVCSGAHVLAAAGVLDGHRATTHWFTASLLAAQYPAIEVAADDIFVRDGNVWTSAGVSSGMDLALAMVADDHTERLAREVARWLVLYLRRPGGQSQFSGPLLALEPRSQKLRDVSDWVAANLDADLSVAALARRAHLSDRHFARLFTTHTGVTPAAFVEASRAEAARRLLEETDVAIEVIATKCGFGSVETLYRTFRRRLACTPNEYRQRFRL
jgi:transcriptional regulator GlxA family with amidase domain